MDRLFGNVGYKLACRPRFWHNLLEPGIGRGRNVQPRFAPGYGKPLRAILVSALCVRAAPRPRAPGGGGPHAGFFTRLLEKGTVRGADPQRGRFRSYLLGAL